MSHNPQFVPRFLFRRLPFPFRDGPSCLKDYLVVESIIRSPRLEKGVGLVVTSSSPKGLVEKEYGGTSGSCVTCHFFKSTPVSGTPESFVSFVVLSTFSTFYLPHICVDRTPGLSSISVHHLHLHRISPFSIFGWVDQIHNFLSPPF